jgi:hypothetical protein
MVEHNSKDIAQWTDLLILVIIEITAHLKQKEKKL